MSTRTRGYTRTRPVPAGMGRVRIDVLRVGPGTGTKSTGTGTLVFTRKEHHFSRCLSYIECFIFFFTRPVLANDTRHTVFKKLYKYYKFIGQSIHYIQISDSVEQQFVKMRCSLESESSNIYNMQRKTFRFDVLKRSLCVVFFVRKPNRPRCNTTTIKCVTVFKREQELIIEMRYPNVT